MKQQLQRQQRLRWLRWLHRPRFPVVASAISSIQVFLGRSPRSGPRSPSPFIIFYAANRAIFSSPHSDFRLFILLSRRRECECSTAGGCAKWSRRDFMACDNKHKHICATCNAIMAIVAPPNDSSRRGDCLDEFLLSDARRCARVFCACRVF